MELTVGYKDSEVGTIPEDWNVVELSQAVEFLDHMRKPIKSADRASMKGQYPYYGASGIIDYVNGYLFDDGLILLGEDGENILSRSLPLAFKVFGKIWVNNHAHVLKPKRGYDIDYLTDYLESLDYTLLNSGTAQPKINKQTCSKIQVVKPPYEEQQAIAKVLSDTDKFIQALEKKIEKKRLIKKGVMQKLLTPKNDWNWLRFDEVFKFKSTASYSRAELSDEEAVSYVHYGDIHTNWEHYLDFSKHRTPKVSFQKAKKYTFLQDGDLIMADASEDYEGVGKSVEVKCLGDRVGIAGLHTYLFRPVDGRIVSGFGGYISSMRDVKREIDKLATGLKVYGISKGNLSSILIPVPSHDEQLRIVSVLSSIDKEISTETDVLRKIKVVKQALMQQLLTGKIRLV